MASRVNPSASPAGCLALPVTAWRRRRARRDGAGRATVEWRRSRFGGALSVRCRVETPRGSAATVVREASARLAAVVSSAGLTVGVVGVVPGEEPVLHALAPRRDLVAPLVQETLTAGAAHRRTRLLVGLHAGSYLATVVDPYRSFDGGAEEIAALLGPGRASYVIAVRADADGERLRIEIAAYGRRPELRRLVSLARKGRAEASRGAAR